MSKTYSLRVDNKEYVVEVLELGSNRFRVKIGDRELVVELAPTRTVVTPTATAEVGDMRLATARVEPETPIVPRVPSNVEVVTAPVPGKVIKVLATTGMSVNERSVLLTLESMKMELEVYSTCAGKVRDIRVKPGDSVNVGDVLILIEKV